MNNNIEKPSSFKNDMKKKFNDTEFADEFINESKITHKLFHEKYDVDEEFLTNKKRKPLKL